jgi:hypothetical protein
VLNVSTTMTVFDRTMTTVCSARNNSISSVYNLGDPHLLTDINITALRVGVEWLLDYTASGLPPQSSVNFWFWFNPFSVYASIWESNAYTSLQSLLAFIIWECCPGNNGNPLVASQQYESLPVGFHTTASVTEPYTKLVLSSITFTTYVVLEIAALMFCWGIVVWQFVTAYFKRALPSISSFPQVDFTGKLRRMSGFNDGHLAPVCPPLPADLNDADIRKSLASARVLVSCLDTVDTARSADFVRTEATRVPPGCTGQSPTSQRNSHAPLSVDQDEDMAEPIDCRDASEPFLPGNKASLSAVHNNASVEASPTARLDDANLTTASVTHAN